MNPRSSKGIVKMPAESGFTAIINRSKISLFPESSVMPLREEEATALKAEEETRLMTEQTS